ncbi:MAG: histidinol dehydrogenase [Synergistales bacterium]|nr:histidinol dehydrogenase [Synergistales bacterium]MDY6401941.1 histidinol dehydrogenase [Synergistales bacterium]MDY6405193.1 histidinol dehydrogenase [Synergistales bacterium]MDY6410037.1 histidinol dehydrogenase [Synergistales bacterium]MDY6414979.1 histidinol dehydrogenase [Synergistales bacterium]
MIKIIEAENFSYTHIKENAHDVSAAVREIIEDVKNNGDEAVKKYEKKFDGVELNSLEVSQAEKDEALKAVGDDFIKILERAAKNIHEFHSRQVRSGFAFSNKDGVILGQRIIPLERVGLYIPGGTASYPSSVLMNAIPAKIAGCKEIFIATPPKIKNEIIAAAEVAGANKIFKMGGAQAVAAFAYGTESVPRVDKISGPGNIFVAEAKRQVFGQVSIDMIAGPSEILIIADENNNPAYIAADMLAQAEHDKLASAVLITDSKNFAGSVANEIEAQIKNLIRHDIARASIDTNGKIILVKNFDEAVKISNEIAPEHLELCVENPFEWLTEGKIKNAGSVFLGKHSPEALGDYYAGPNHTLPTMGTARFSSPLSVDDFVKKSQYIFYTQDALKKVSDDIAKFAESEGLTGHANSVLIRK